MNSKIVFAMNFSIFPWSSLFSLTFFKKQLYKYFLTEASNKKVRAFFQWTHVRNLVVKKLFCFSRSKLQTFTQLNICLTFVSSFNIFPFAIMRHKFTSCLKSVMSAIFHSTINLPPNDNDIHLPKLVCVPAIEALKTSRSDLKIMMGIYDVNIWI